MKIIKIKIKLNIKNACKNIYKNTRLLLVLYAPPAGKVSNFEAVRRQVLKKSYIVGLKNSWYTCCCYTRIPGRPAGSIGQIVPPKKKKKVIF
jgi:hypothetical protein